MKKTTTVPDVTLTDEEYSRAVEAGQANEPRARSARYDRAKSRLIIELQNGVVLMIPTALLQGLDGASAKDLAAVEILADGYALHWPSLDADFTVPGLVQGIFGTDKWMREIASQFLSEAGRKGGSASTPEKQASSRANGKLGGRPRKVSVAA